MCSLRGRTHLLGYIAEPLDSTVQHCDGSPVDTSRSLLSFTTVESLERPKPTESGKPSGLVDVQ